MRPTKKIVICITEYCKIAKREIRLADKGGVAWRTIEDFDMFAKGIYATEEIERWEADALLEIQENLKDVLGCDREGKYFIQQAAQQNKEKVHIPVFLELCYIAFQKRKEQISFLRTFIQVHYLKSANEIVSQEEMERYQKSLGKEWEKKIVDLYKYNVSGNDSGKKCSKLGDICKTDKAFFSDLEKNCIRGKNSIHDMNS